MRWPCAVGLALALGACSSESADLPRHMSWAGSEALLKTQDTYQAQAYHQDGVLRAQEALGGPPHLTAGPLTDAQVEQARDDFLRSLGQGCWLHGGDLAAAAEPAQTRRWRAALEGQDLSVAFETGALVRERQTLWRRVHGERAAGPTPGMALPNAAAWQDAMGTWSPDPNGTPLVLLDADETTQALIAARAGVLDAHTLHVRPVMAQAYNQHALRMAEGLGVGLRDERDRLVVALVETGSPADQGRRVRVGDVLVAIQLPGQGWVPARGLDAVTERLRAARGRVGLRLIREKRETTVWVESTGAFAWNSERLKVHDETWARLGGAPVRALRLEMTFFYESGADRKGVAEDVHEALLAAVRSGRTPDVVVLDLRRCRGGGLPEALGVAGAFVDGGPLLQVRGRGASIQVLADPSPGADWRGPVQIWVGPQTASAAEAAVQAVRDRRLNSRVLGWPTYGKGTLQRRIELDLDRARRGQPSRLGEVWVTVGELYGPAGRSLQRTGVSLDGRLPGGTPEPWGERALERARAPRPPLDGRAPQVTTRLISVSNFLHPAQTDAEALPQWREAALQMLPTEPAVTP